MTPAHLDEVGAFLRPLMAGFPARWGVAGGWALDLFVGRATRPHADVELAVFRRDQALLRRHLRGWTFEKIVGGRREAWPDEQRLSLPVHEIHARSMDEPSHAIEFLLNERDGDNWIFRRNPTVTLPLDRAIRPAAVGLPVLAPEIVMLFKAKSPRPKDEADFRTACTAMDQSRRRWLRAALQVCHPNHPWIESLDAATGSDA